MKVKVVKAHHKYAKGVHDLTEQEANYLIRSGVAEVHKDKKK